ncbi:MAG: VWA domain-containing protein [Acidobacteria bacterium]|nr:VWA domain-containing protein [Acidobacteriota bacterium]
MKSLRSAAFLAAIVAIVALVSEISGSVDAAGKTGDALPTPTPTPAAKPAPTATPIPEDDVIRVEAELVNLNVRVVDRNNRTINDVPEKDFKIYEDGVLQTIDFFSRSEVPTNYALVIDNSGSLRAQLDKVIEAGKILVDMNKPEDETEIVRFIGRDKITIEQPFTANKQDLSDSLENLFIEGGQTAIIDAVYLAVENVDKYEQSKKIDERRRRAIVLVTDGEDRDSYYNEKQLLDLLRESEVQIYVVGFLGDLSKEGGFIGKSPQEKARAFLQRMADESGGKTYFPADASELPNIAKQISGELRTQYSIGYIPTNDRKDGKFRSIKVVVADGPNGQKRIPVTRAGRTADNSDAPPRLAAPANTTKLPKN